MIARMASRYNVQKGNQGNDELTFRTNIRRSALQKGETSPLNVYDVIYQNTVQRG